MWGDLKIVYVTVGAAPSTLNPLAFPETLN